MYRLLLLPVAITILRVIHTWTGTTLGLPVSLLRPCYTPYCNLVPLVSGTMAVALTVVTVRGGSSISKDYGVTTRGQNESSSLFVLHYGFPIHHSIWISNQDDLWKQWNMLLFMNINDDDASKTLE
jgi:hypothetical protein